MTPLDMVARDEIQRVLDDVAEEFSVHTTLQDADGKILLEGGAYPTLCATVRARPQLLSFVCGLSNTSMVKVASEQGGPHSDLCELGMFKTVVPIFHDGSYVGALSACGASLADEPLDAFVVSKTLDIDEADAEDLVKEIKTLLETEGQALTEALERGVDLF